MTAGLPPGHLPAVPASRRSPCLVPLWSVLYPPAGRGSPAVQGREAWPDQPGAARKRPGLAGKRKASRPCPAPHQPGHRPNNRPPLPPPPIPPPRKCTQERKDHPRRKGQ